MNEMVIFKRCPGCGAENSAEYVRQMEDIQIHNETIQVEVEFYRCKECQEEWMLLDTEHDILDAVLGEYRQRNQAAPGAPDETGA